MTTADRVTDFVQSLERGLAVIRAFRSSDALTPSEVAAETNLTRAAARRFLLTLAELGYVRADRKSFRLTPRVLELGAGYLAALALPELALPLMRTFVDEIRESSSLAVLDGDDAVYVAHVSADRVLSVFASVGERDPAHATSLGRVLVAAKSDEWIEEYLGRVEIRAFTDRTIVDREALRAELAQVRRQGWALVDQELEAGLRALAVPVRDTTGEVVAAVNVGLHTSRWQLDEIRASLLPRLLHLTSSLSAALVAKQAAQTDVDPATAIDHDHERGVDFVQSLERGLAVIRAFAGTRTELTLSDVAVATGLTRAAARRFLLTLAELGYVAVDGRAFRLTPRVLELGSGYLSRLTLTDVVQPHLRRLVASVHESSSVAVLEGADILYEAHEAAERILAVTVNVGSRDPAWVTALGRVLLAAQPDAWIDEYLEHVAATPFTARTLVDPGDLRAEIMRVRARGWAIVDEEFEEGLRALAVPIVDRSGTVLAAVNVSMHATRWATDEMISSLLPRLQATASAISADLRAIGTTPAF